MLAFDLEQFLSGLSAAQRYDPLIREFVGLCDAKSRAEKITGPSSGTCSGRRSCSPLRNIMGAGRECRPSKVDRVDGSLKEDSPRVLSGYP